MRAQQVRQNKAWHNDNRERFEDSCSTENSKKSKICQGKDKRNFHWPSVLSVADDRKKNWDEAHFAYHRKVFGKAVVQPNKEKPVVVVLDGYSTHSKNLGALEFCRQHHIHLLQLPSHTTHRLQLLVVGFFKPLQTYFVQEQDSWLRAHIGQAITVYNIAELLGSAYGKAASVGVSESAFRGAGVWPVNRNKFADYLFAAATAVETHFTKQEKVADESAGSTNQAIFIENSTAAENSSSSRSSVTKTPNNTDKVPGEITLDKLNQSSNEFPGTSKTIQRRKTETTASAVILTSTPYKKTETNR
ncbi:hypothetical protein JTB14_005771 [Gonioctena quinquepunctata]|nr:hypothetical protein JTB14_005771 [Gonioctena quinquepunctata]